MNRFWSKVDIKGPDECWPWKLKLDNSGYGRFLINRKMKPAQRMAYCLQHNIDILALSPKIQVRHTCGYKPCCNPAHLVHGSNKENLNDINPRTGRTPGGDGVFTAILAGTKSGVKVSLADVHYIWCHKGMMTTSKMARRFNISNKQVLGIWKGHSWQFLLNADDPRNAEFRRRVFERSGIVWDGQGGSAQ